MMDRIRQGNKKLLISVGILLILATLFLIYFYTVYPKGKEVEQKEREIIVQEQLLKTLLHKDEETNETFINTVQLQELVPVKPLTQQILLDIKKAETISGSFVVNMSFQDGQAMEETKETEEAQIKGMEEIEGEQEKAKMEVRENTIPLPAGVEKIAVNLTVESPTYFEMEKFLQALEGLRRIIVIEAIDFNAGDEILEENQEKKPLTYQVSLSAFYMPTLLDLINQLPQIDTPPPAKKRNPLSSFGNITGSSVENKQAEAEGQNEQPKQTKQTESPEQPKKEQEIVYYKVQPNDTLFSISMKFFKSRRGEQIIRQQNKLQGNKVMVGQTLKIPIDK